MEVTKTMRLITFLALVLSAPITAFSQTQAYVCGSTSVTLVPDLSGYTLQAGDVVRWTNVATSAYVDQSTANYTPATLAIGDNQFTVQIRPAAVGACLGDVSLPYTIHKLPGFTVPIAASATTYCTGTGTPSTITASPALDGAPNGYVLPADVTYEYTWSATDGSGAVTIGSLGTNADGVFTMVNTATAGNYNITAAAKYKITSAVPLRPATSCEVSSAAQPITITTKPGTPTIAIQ